MKKDRVNLEKISDENLLGVRVCDLPITIQETWLSECIDQLYKELEAKEIVFRPECYLADEWLTPEKETCIGIPFYLAHPSLIRLEKKFMIDAEGDGKQWCMKLLRHETGHAISYAYKLHKRKKWQRIFGPSNIEYKDTYKYRAYSKNYVRHLDGYYAQYHPDEDFVETFAVWLTPELDWATRYKGWRALEKLKYVDRIMNEIKGKVPPVKSAEKFYRLSTLRFTLDTYYRRKRYDWAEGFPDFHDRFLKRLFEGRNKENQKKPLLSNLISKHRRNILNSVSRYSGEKKYVINDLLRDIQKRSRELKLVSDDEESFITTNLSSYVTSLIMNYLYTGRFRGEKESRKKR